MQRHLAAALPTKSQKKSLLFLLFSMLPGVLLYSLKQHMLGILNGNAQIHAKHFLVISEGWFEEPCVDGFLRTSSVSDILP